ncbi:IRF3 factor, partial [Anseranas semipalmata]|nr:IRF3 factor [Anseranas semipalmata]
MAALESEGDAQKLRFGPWLLNAVSSGVYRGLCWTDPARNAFRIPWKHNARKDVTSSDIEIFKAWAKASGRYEGNSEDPAKWKTNFRCALRSTHMFVLLEDHSKNSDDPHKVFAVTSGEPSPTGSNGGGELSSGHPTHPAFLPATPQNGQGGGSATAAPAQLPVLEELDALQWVLQQCDISALGSPPSPWPPAGDVLHENALLQCGPGQGGCLPLQAVQEWVPAVEQPPLGAYRPSDPMLLEEQTIPGQCCPRATAGAVPLPCHPHPGGQEAVVPVPSPGEAQLFHPAASPGPPPDDNGGIPPILDVTIYYRGKTVHQEVVGDSQCLLAYECLDPAVALQPGQLVLFPSPEGLADGKQRRFTEELLVGVGLRLEQRAGRLFATRLKKCRVFWALSQQLDGGHPPPNLLCRDQETAIFDFNEFCTELRDFRDNRRERSPDFTIFLCFGQCFSNCKPKESKLILVKLVPKFCEYWYEQVLREGASSLNSGNVSLQLSDSFNLYELIEQYNMQTD